MGLRETERECGLYSSASGYGPVEDFCEQCDEPWGSIKCLEILE
jgi:hypothetical protein